MLEVKLIIEGPGGAPAGVVTHDDLNRAVQTLRREITRMATQADVDQLVTQVQQVATDIDNARTAILARFEQIAADHPGVDLSQLQADVAPLDAAVQALGQLQPSQPAPAPDPGAGPGPDAPPAVTGA